MKSINASKVKVPFWSTPMVVIVLIIVLMTGCGSSEDNYSESADMDYGGSVSTNTDMDMTEEAPAVTGSELTADGAGEVTGEDYSDYVKYVLTYYYDLETLEFDQSRSDLDRLVDQSGGYFQNAEVSGKSIDSNAYNSRRQGNFIVRIPVDQVDEFLNGLSGIGNELSARTSKEDVTNQYYDLEVRIESLEIRENNLMEMLKDAKDLEYMIILEQELADVRYEIESYMTSFRNLEHRISYSTIYIYLKEVKEVTIIEEEPETMFEEIASAFGDSLENIGDFFRELFVFLVGRSPVLIVYAVFGFIIYRIYKRIKRRRALRPSKKPKEKHKKSTQTPVEPIEVVEEKSSKNKNE